MNAVLAFLDAYRGVVLIATVVIIMAIEWAGRQGSLWLMEKAFGAEFAERYDTRWTAIGVIHHELSHLLVALFTGARIDKYGGTAAALCEPGVWVAAILMAQIAYHSCPSAQDIKGSWISILIFALLVAFSNFRYFTLDLSLWIIRTVLVAMAVSTAPAVVISILFIAVNGVKYLQHTLAAGRY